LGVHVEAAVVLQKLRRASLVIVRDGVASMPSVRLLLRRWKLSASVNPDSVEEGDQLKRPKTVTRLLTA
jgi:hypothetical protein